MRLTRIPAAVGVLIAGVTVACNDGGGAVCGDGVCDPGELATACPYDCAGPTCDPAQPGACAGEAICVDRQCVGAFGRGYVFTVASGTFPVVDAAGQPWDAAGDPPDGLVRITIGDASFTTPVAPDTWAPGWDAATPSIVVEAGATYAIDVLERDPTGDALAWSCAAAPLTAARLAHGVLVCASPTLPDARVTITVRPG
ncbi:MAG: hypothetical protein JNK64_02805 [Myxococcales bacterium]|nr:hypothetical protein [Myxococcales bacterium]